MRTSIFILFTLLFATPLFALDMDYRLSGHVGWIMPDGKVDLVTSPNNQATGLWIGPTGGADLSVTFYPNWHALRQWNHAGIGVGLTHWAFPHDKLGQAFSAYTYLEIPLVRLPHFILGLRPAIGVAFNTKTYRNTIPAEDLYATMEGSNRCIGGMINLYFPEAMYIDFPITKGWTIGISGGWYHISNGSVRQPNSGYNIFAAELGVRYSSNSDTRHSSAIAQGHKAHYPASDKPWLLTSSVSASGRQVYYKDQQTFFVGSMHVAAYWNAHPIFRLGAGIDVFYDGAYIQRTTQFQKTNLAAAQPGDCWRVGASLQPEFVVGNFALGLQVGAYLYDPVKELEPYSEAILSPTGRIKKPIFYAYDLLNAGSAGYPDGWIYTCVVAKYYLPWHIFVQAMMKSHLTKVEFISLGLGFYY